MWDWAFWNIVAKWHRSRSNCMLFGICDDCLANAEGKKTTPSDLKWHLSNWREAKPAERDGLVRHINIFSLSVSCLRIKAPDLLARKLATSATGPETKSLRHSPHQYSHLLNKESYFYEDFDLQEANMRFEASVERQLSRNFIRRQARWLVVGWPSAVPFSASEPPEGKEGGGNPSASWVGLDTMSEPSRPELPELSEPARTPPCSVPIPPGTMGGWHILSTGSNPVERHLLLLLGGLVFNWRTVVAGKSVVKQTGQSPEAPVSCWLSRTPEEPTSSLTCPSPSRVGHPWNVLGCKWDVPLQSHRSLVRAVSAGEIVPPDCLCMPQL